MYAFLTILALVISVLQTKVVSVDYPFLVSNSQANLNQITTDFEDNVFIVLDNGEVRKFLPNMTAYINVTLMNGPLQLKFNSFAYTLQILSLAYLSGSSKSMTSIDSLSMSVSVHDYFNYSLVAHYSSSQTIRMVTTIPLNSGNKTTYLVIVVAEQSVRVFYEGGQKWVVSLLSLIGVNANLISWVQMEQQVATQLNYLEVTLNYQLSFQNNIVYHLSVLNNLSYNAITSQFDLLLTTQTFTIFQIYSNPITFLSYKNQFLLQQQSSGLIHIYSFQLNQLITVNSAIPTAPIQQFFYLSGCYYLLQNNAFLEIQFVTTVFWVIFYSYEWLYVNTISLLPVNSYRMTAITSSQLMLLYLPGTPNMYKAGQCSGSFRFDGSSCQSYTCLVANCSYCPINPYICGVCDNQYNRVARDYTCEAIEYFNDIKPAQSGFKQLAEDIQSVVIQIIKIPGARKVLTPIFCYFGNFDDLFFYQFHDRTYGYTMDYVFEMIAQVESAKWSFISAEEILSFFSKGSLLLNFTNYQTAYLTFDYSVLKQEGSEGFLSNCLNFFVITVPLLIILFVSLQFVWKNAKKLPGRVWLREFNFKWYLLILIFEGNIQQFAFYLAAEFTHLFYFFMAERLLKAFFILFGFLLLIYSVGGSVLCFATNNKKNGILMDNAKNSFKGALLLTLVGLRNFLLGFMHYFLRHLQYYQLMNALLTLQWLFVGFTIVFIMRKDGYKIKMKAWFSSLMTFCRIVLLFTLTLDYQAVNHFSIEIVQQALLCLMVLLFLIGIFHELLMYIFEAIKSLKRQRQEEEEEQKQQIREEKKVSSICTVQIQEKIFFMNKTSKFTATFRTVKSSSEKATKKRNIKPKFSNPEPLPSRFKQVQKIPILNIQWKILLE